MLKHRYAGAGLLAAFLLLAAPVSRALPDASVAPVARGASSSVDAPVAAAPAAPAAAIRPIRVRRAKGPIRLVPFSHVAMGETVSPLGVGMELATPMGRHLNVSAAANLFHFRDSLSTNGMQFQAHVSFTSVEASLDWYPWGRSFHISPGALVYANNRVWAAGGVPGGSTFSVNNANYMSSRTDPVHGDAQVAFGHFAPMLTVGWGNPIPREGRRWSIPFAVGFAYVGDPKTELNFAGTACDSTGTYCAPVSKLPGLQSNLDVERARLQKNANYMRFLPVISIGYSVRF